MAIKVHLGCGKRDFGRDWFHVDGEAFPHIDHDDIFRLPFEEGTVDLIYAAHLVEYFDQVEVIDILRKWGKYLKPGGVLRLAVPDFEVMARLYTENRITLLQIIGPLYGRMPLRNSHIFHRTTYDYATLSQVLTTSGFKNVSRYDWWLTEHAMHDDHSQAYIPHMDKENGTLISLNVECQR